MRRLHTAVGDEIRRIAQTDPERAAEMRAGADGNDEYAREVRGFYDTEIDPQDLHDDRPDRDEDRDEEEQVKDRPLTEDERRERQAEYDEQNPPPIEWPLP